MKVLSLFSGIGGFDLGLERAGMEVVAQCDNDAFCNKVLAKHWPGVTRYDDVRLIRYESLRPLQERETAGRVSSAAARGPGTALLVRPVLQRLLQGTPGACDAGAAPSLEHESALWLDAGLIERDAPGAEESLCDLRAANGSDEGGSRPRDRQGARAAVPSLQPAAGGRREPGVSQAGADLPPFVDVIVGGFPCQDLSVAGLRRGLQAERSGLFYEFMRIVREMREASDGRFPRVVVAENVPGLFSSASGRDFGAVLNALAECGAVDIAWRVIDSQHWVPQRRRRVFIVALFPPAADGRAPIGRASEILSLCEGGDWNTQTRRAAGEDVAGTIAGGAYGAGRRPDNLSDNLVANSLRAQPNASHRLDNDTYIPTVGHQVQTKHRSDYESETLVTHSLRADGFDASEDGTGRGTPLVAWNIQHNDGGQHKRKDRPEGGFYVNETDVALTVGTTDLTAIQQTAGVRRLTPVECERLQGFPDNWTKLDDKTPDGPRYKALGNAVSVPVIEYLGKRIMAVLS